MSLLPYSIGVGHAYRHHLSVGSAKYRILLFMGQCYTHMYDTMSSANVPYDIGHKFVHRFVDGSPTSPALHY